ncbi:MAG: glycoside hydrolase family 2 TIM barrel-domain containing protein [Fimbriimonadaceae bacterium]
MIFPLLLMTISKSTSTSTLSNNAPSVVRIVNTDGKFSLTVNGKPYFIKGAGGTGSMSLLAECGGNSVRTWGADQLKQTLDEAQKHGIKVTAGIWLQHSGSFDYSDKAAVKRQFDASLEAVKEFKDHPALLMWAFGNEMESYGNADDPNVYIAINDIAKAAKEIDPNHPTMTVTAEIGAGRVPGINKYCPDIDIMGINSYGGAASVAERYGKAGGKKPYVITEFGPLGQWEVAKTEWQAPIEQTSTEKMETYRTAYKNAVLSNPNLCLGAYAFLWGNKQEATSTWFGMLLPDGTKVGPVDVMTEFWTGKPPANLCPLIKSLKIDTTTQLSKGQVVNAKLEATDPNGDPLTVKWVLVGETEVYLSGGQDEKVPPKHPQALLKHSQLDATFKMPNEKGGYRIFAYVYDGKGGAAVANIPINVND